MFKILFLLFAGIGVGYTFRRVSFLHKVETTISLTVFFMLFVFGLSIGSNDKLMDNLGKYGYQAFILALFGVVGSLLASYLAYRFVFKKGGHNEK